MAQRHVHDTVERLWPGAADPRHPHYVEVELRDTVADCPPGVEERLRRSLYGVKEMVRVLDAARGDTIIINPSANPADLETGLVWRKREWAATRIVGQRAEAEQSANDRRLYTCASCRQIVTPGITGHAHVTARMFSDGTRLSVCGKCAIVLEHLAAERVAAETIDGRSRAELAAAALERIAATRTKTT